MKALNILGIILLFVLLTALSQVGGLILLLWILLYQFFKKRFKNAWVRRGVHVGGFVVFYLFFMFVIIPPLARIQDRVPLPMSKSGALVPVTYWTAIFGRNYIKSEGKAKLETIAEAFVKKHPDLKVKYMDCNYPFRKNISGDKNTWILEGLLPHITHDGTKADIALIYDDANGKPMNETPTFFGYGSSVDPQPDETCTPCNCDSKYWQYSFMYRNLPRTEYPLNIKVSSELIKIFDRHLTDKIILEKHLQQRFKLHGNFTEADCNSVRHDDHFHVTLCP
ncbi:MAG: hypothetical protein FJY06_01930 [Bacteroidetes bacterium]|nr:hypothetical protein [Bacteroidota bacterium]